MRTPLQPGRLIGTLVGAACVSLTALLAQQAMQMNVAYRCPDGSTRTITRCQATAQGDSCAWREERGGQLVAERTGTRAQMDSWINACTAPPAKAKPPASPGAPPTLDPSYLNGMPSVEKVKRDIHGGTPAEAAARQVAILEFLPYIIINMQTVPSRPYGSGTMDEARTSMLYNQAAEDLRKRFKQAATPDEAKQFDQLMSQYTRDLTIRDLMFTLFTPAFLDEFTKATRAIGAAQQARIDQQKRQNEAFTAPAASNGMRNDPGSLAVRRCLELGGGDFECIGKGMSTGFADLLGFDLNAFAATPSAKPGLSVGGTYQTDGGIMVDFSEDSASISHCGVLVPLSLSYTVTRRGDSFQVQLSNRPAAMAMTLGPDGRLAGPASSAVTGQYISGYEVYWVQQRRVSDNTIVPGSGHEERVPVYSPKTETCAFGTLRVSGPVTAESSMIGLIVGIAGGEANPAAKKTDTSEAPAGVRMTGSFSSAGGLKMEFHPTAALLDCGEAHVLRPYTVANTADRLTVTVKNGTSPFTLTLQPDGTLTGAGTVEVAGRVVTGTGANGATFAPRTARCGIDSLSPAR
jgi:hypothetical protein